jgi:hypothetical protein
MRVNLITQSSAAGRAAIGTLAISLTICPAAGGFPGDFLYPTDSANLLRLLKRNTDLPSTVLERFAKELRTSAQARLLGVELSDHLLTKMGYFVD